MAFSGTWKELYEAARAEADAEKLPGRIKEARSALMARVDELIDDPERKPEHDEILLALEELNRIASSSRRAA